MLGKSSSSKFTPQVTQNLTTPQQTQESSCLELDHLTGYNGRFLKTIHFHPKNPNIFIYCIGGLVVIEDINDRHKQDFLRGHDMNVTALAVSSSGFIYEFLYLISFVGNYVISGQEGTINSKIPESPVFLIIF